MFILETERYKLREFEILDAQDIYLLNSDNEALKYAGDVPFKSMMEAEQFLVNQDQYTKYVLDRWAVIYIFIILFISDLNHRTFYDFR